VVLAAVGVLAIGIPLVAPHPAAAADGRSSSYVGPDHGEGPPTSPTRFAHQSKLWFHADAWWALMLDPAGNDVRVHELLPDHTWRATGTVVNADPVDTGDALSVGDAVYAVSRRTDGLVQLARLRFDPDRREYVPDGGPRVVTDRGTGAPPSIARDTTGKLWVSFATADQVVAVTSADNGSTWSAPPTVLPGPPPSFPTREVATVASFDTSIGILWTDQAAGVVRFGVHRDGAPNSEWKIETALEGTPVADHLSLKVLDRDPADAVVAAVRTAPADPAAPPQPPDAPVVTVLSRAPDGTWSHVPAATADDGLNSPSIQLDATNGTIYLLGHARGTIQIKQAPIDSPAFGDGRVTAFVTAPGAGLVDAGGSKQPADARTGLVTMASGTVDHRYHHGELGLPGVPPAKDPPDTTAPTTPTDLVAQASGGPVILSWSAGSDGTRWTPAADREPVRSYTVSRDGTEIGTTEQLSFADDADAGARHEYAVRSVDFAGNLSDPAIASVTVPESGPSATSIIGWTLLGIATVLGVAVGFRRRLRR
jgi:hypothetical protein